MGPWECAQRDTDPLSLLRKWYLCERRPQRASSMPFPQLLCFPSSTSDTTVCSGQRHEGRRHRHSFCQGQHRLIPLSEHPCNSTGSSEAMAKTKQRVCLRCFWLTRPSCLALFLLHHSTLPLAFGKLEQNQSSWYSAGQDQKYAFSPYLWSRNFCSCTELLRSEGQSSA